MIAHLALLVVLAAAAAPASPPDATAQDRLSRCLARIDADPEAAYEEARAWAAEQAAREAFACAALADIARGRPSAAARQLEALAEAAPKPEQPGLFAQAGNAWLLAGDRERALKTLSQALALAPSDADALVDRARAYALGRDWRRAEEDLNRALDARPQDPVALALRAETRLRQGAFDLAVRDAERAQAFAPESVEAALSLGRAREAKRSGAIPPD